MSEQDVSAKTRPRCRTLWTSSRLLATRAKLSRILFGTRRSQRAPRALKIVKYDLLRPLVQQDFTDICEALRLILLDNSGIAQEFSRFTRYTGVQKHPLVDAAAAVTMGSCQLRFALVDIVPVLVMIVNRIVRRAIRETARRTDYELRYGR